MWDKLHKKHGTYKSSLTQSQENYLQYCYGFINILLHIPFVLSSHFTGYNHQLLFYFLFLLSFRFQNYSTTKVCTIQMIKVFLEHFNWHLFKTTYCAPTECNPIFYSKIFLNIQQKMSCRIHRVLKQITMAEKMWKWKTSNFFTDQSALDVLNERWRYCIVITTSVVVVYLNCFTNIYFGTNISNALHSFVAEVEKPLNPPVSAQSHTCTRSLKCHCIP